jgi:hypothetical protein
MLINTDGLTLIGPGSEWFWTAFSGIVLIITFVAIYRQLRMQASETAIRRTEEWEREGSSETFRRAALEITTAIRDGVDPARIPDAPARTIGGLWERYALLTRKGHRDAKLLWEWENDAAQGWWAMLGPRARRLRAETGDADIYANFEWLSDLMAKMDRKAGKPLVDLASIRNDLDDLIAFHGQKVREAEAARTIIYVPGVAPVLPAPPAPPQVAASPGIGADAPQPAAPAS